MSRSVHQVLASAVVIAGLAALTGCSERPSASAYAAFEARERAKGNLRFETAPQDAPYDAGDLVRNFERIALHHESDPTKSGSQRNWTPNPLQRWEGPLRYGLAGAGVTPADRAEVASLMRRIAGLTGLEISRSDIDPNFWILISEPEERDGISASLAQVSPVLAEHFELWRNNRQVHCLGDNLFSSTDPNVFSHAMVVIGAEMEGLLRRACLHEEIVQLLGLANDHPEVRPSIFNDDGEFALLTEHDEHLLRILYDPRLRPGMTAAEAMPVVRRIVAGIPLGPEARLAAGAAAGAPAADDGAARPPATQDAPAN
ncbi:MAG: DUF2927 domain-containing protein [Paracoccaceae bacterium]